MRLRSIGLVAAALFAATVVFSNYLVTHYGIVGVGFGLHAPAAVFAVGLAFTLRDVVQRTLGPWAAIAAILVGATLSLLVSPHFAVASGVAFLASELLDLAVYTPLERRTWIGAIVLSNTVGLVVDSIVFLSLAFGSLALLAGQLVGKAEMTLLAVLVILLVRRSRALLPRHA